MGRQSQVVTVISWLTYPVVYIFPMLGFHGAHAVVAIQCGYCASDIISKCGGGLIIYQITSTKSEMRRSSVCSPEMPIFGLAAGTAVRVGFGRLKLSRVSKSSSVGHERVDLGAQLACKVEVRLENVRAACLALRVSCEVL